MRAQPAAGTAPEPVELGPVHRFCDEANAACIFRPVQILAAAIGECRQLKGTRFAGIRQRKRAAREVIIGQTGIEIRPRFREFVNRGGDGQETDQKIKRRDAAPGCAVSQQHRACAEEQADTQHEDDDADGCPPRPGGRAEQSQWRQNQEEREAKGGLQPRTEPDEGEQHHARAAQHAE
ncbi:MAG: hypothetical protein ABSA49_01145 [Rhizomicrobium sp.]